VKKIKQRSVTRTECVDVHTLQLLTWTCGQCTGSGRRGTSATAVTAVLRSGIGTGATSLLSAGVTRDRASSPSSPVCPTSVNYGKKQTEYLSTKLYNLQNV